MGKLILVGGWIALCMGVGLAWSYTAMQNTRNEAIRQVLLLHLPKAEEDRFQAAIRLANSDNAVADTLAQAKVVAAQHPQPQGPAAGVQQAVLIPKGSTYDPATKAFKTPDGKVIQLGQ